MHNPLIVLKDRPYSEQGFEVALGEVHITNRVDVQDARWIHDRFKEVFVNIYHMEAKNIAISYAGSTISLPFDMKMDFEKLCHSILLEKIPYQG